MWVWIGIGLGVFVAVSIGICVVLAAVLGSIGRDITQVYGEILEREAWAVWPPTRAAGEAEKASAPASARATLSGSRFR